MKIHASRAMENGLIAQLMNSVTPTPRQCCLTSTRERKSILSSIGRIISQMSTATGRFTRAISMAPSESNAGGNSLPSVIPMTMHSATQMLRYFSKNGICALVSADLANVSLWVLNQCLLFGSISDDHVKACQPASQKPRFNHDLQTNARSMSEYFCKGDSPLPTMQTVAGVGRFRPPCRRRYRSDRARS